MSVTSFSTKYGRYLTEFSSTTRPGDIVTISFGSRSKLRRSALSMRGIGCEFTHYLLTEDSLIGYRGDVPLFDLNMCPKACPVDVMTFPISADVVRHLDSLPIL